LILVFFIPAFLYLQNYLNTSGMKAINKFVWISFIFCSLLIIIQSSYAQQVKEKVVAIETTFGVIKIKLYEETGMHKDNFIKLVNEGFYNGVLFHRVIKDFMVQTGDPGSINAKPGVPLGTGGPGYTVPAEIYANCYHKKGAVAAARMGDNVNPNRESSGSQFYIVQGKKYSPEQLTSMENSNQHPRFTDEQKQVYTTIGGTPHLDYTYTVFGEVVEGLELVDKIASVATDQRNRPIEDILILKAYIIK
jgi:cyclophilin family peptidyl-prolyl cis-trans isomerase